MGQCTGQTVNINVMHIPKCCMCDMYTSKYSLEGQVSEESDRKEDGRDSTANVCDKCEDSGLDGVGYRLSGEVLQTQHLQGWLPPIHMET